VGAIGPVSRSLHTASRCGAVLCFTAGAHSLGRSLDQAVPRAVLDQSPALAVAVTFLRKEWSAERRSLVQHD